LRSFGGIDLCDFLWYSWKVEEELIPMRTYVSLVLLGLFLAGCATATPTQKGAVTGSALGAGIGAIIGHQSGETAKGALIGAAAGGLGGALVGDAMATQFCPTCGRDYFGDQTHCQLDGAALRQKGAPPQTQKQASSEASLPKYCAECGRSFTAGDSYCSEDGTALKEKSL